MSTVTPQLLTLLAISRYQVSKGLGLNLRTSWQSVCVKQASLRALIKFAWLGK